MSLNRLPSVFGPTPNQKPLASTQEHQSILNSFRAQVKSGLSGVAVDHSFLSSVIDAIKHTDAIDDRKLLLEHVLTLLSRLPPSALATKLQNSTVQLLYNDLPHPPATYIGNKYAWRTADGAGNNVEIPDMGRAGTPYSRSVQQSHAIPQNSLPDAGLVFDTLLKRDGFVPHPAGLSSMMFSFAALVIHTVFRTSHTDVNINETSSYVDLAPLYGSNQLAQDKIRVRDGRGLLYPDVFAEDRLLLLPPAVCVILVLFSRNHNYIAKRILEINERGYYIDPSTPSSDPNRAQRLLDQEEEIFQIARLVNCTWFASVVFSDYFSSILGLVREGNNWILGPFGEIRNEDHSMFQRGQGNVCSVEFNCLYRWHATTSVEDAKWVEAIFGQLFPGKTPQEITPQEFKIVAKKMQESEPDIKHWTFGTIQRQADGTFKDSDLANILKNATDHPAGAFRARGTPEVMRLHEVMGIEQNRRWGVCSLNDFRRFLGLKPYATFKEWNPNPEIYEAAEKLYANIEYLELYVGLQAEEAKPVVEGAGLCPGYTISRAILSDAIALTRGDRFYTSDYTPYNMTAWGFADCQRQPNGAGFGSTLGRLMLRTLPNDFTYNSVYTWFPLMLPQSMKTHLTKLKLLPKYDLARPGSLPSAIPVKDYNTVSQILKDHAGFHTPYAARASSVIKGSGFFLATLDPTHGERDQRGVLGALINTPQAEDKIGQFFYNKTRELITASSFTLVDGKSRCADIVQYVLRQVPIYWVASEIAGIQLKTKQTPHGDYTPEQLFDMLADIYSFIFLEVEPYKLVVLEGTVKGYIQELLRHIKNNLSTYGGQRMSIAGLVDTISHMFAKPKLSERHELVQRLHDLGHSSDEVANSILAIMVGFSVELSLAFTNVVNTYLGSSQHAQLCALAIKPEPKGQLEGLVHEALRLDPPFQGVYRIAQKDQTIGSHSVHKNDRLLLDIAKANLDGHVFDKPMTVVANRTLDRYLNGDVTVRCLGNQLTNKVIGEVLRAVFALPNVRRAPGQSGTLTRFRDGSQPAMNYSYLDSNQFSAPWATSLVIQYDVI